jgi:hypothetical protein
LGLTSKIAVAMSKAEKAANLPEVMKYQEIVKESATRNLKNKATVEEKEKNEASERKRKREECVEEEEKREPGEKVDYKKTSADKVQTTNN